MHLFFGGEDSTLQFIWHHNTCKITNKNLHIHTQTEFFHCSKTQWISSLFALGVSWEDSGLVKLSASQIKNSSNFLLEFLCD